LAGVAGSLVLPQKH